MLNLFLEFIFLFKFLDELPNSELGKWNELKSNFCLFLIFSSRIHFNFLIQKIPWLMFLHSSHILAARGREIWKPIWLKLLKNHFSLATIKQQKILPLQLSIAVHRAPKIPASAHKLLCHSIHTHCSLLVSILLCNIVIAEKLIRWSNLFLNYPSMFLLVQHVKIFCHLFLSMYVNMYDLSTWTQISY